MNTQEFLSLQEAYNQVYQLDEGMTMKDFKQQRSRQKQKEKRAADKIAPGRRKDIHTDRLSPERAARHRANVDPDFDYGPAADERNYPGGKLNPKKVRKAKALGELGEGYDLYDIILSHLLDEGYAETEEAAEVIMVNMSEEWRQTIIEMDDFAAGGGSAKMKATGMTRDQVVALGKKNLATKTSSPSIQKPVGSSNSAVGSTPSDALRDRLASREKYRDTVTRALAAGTSPVGLARREAAKSQEAKFNEWEKRQPKPTGGYHGLAGS